VRVRVLEVQVQVLVDLREGERVDRGRIVQVRLVVG
jgi:hypothetical protein